MSEKPREDFDKEEIRSRLKFPEVLAREYAVELRRAGTALQCRCPFHEEKSASFSIKGGENGDFGHCFGCGWSGDIFKLWIASRNCTFAEAKRDLAQLAGVASMPTEVKWKHSGKRPQITEDATPVKRERRKPALPGLKRCKPDDIAALAELRGLSVAGVKVAAESFRRVAMCQWPQWHSDRTGQWRVAEDAARSWVVLDESRWVAQYRRLDGAPYEIRRKDKEVPDEVKCWTAGSPTWPLGAEEIGRRAKILLVEGGADMLAAYHFLHAFGLLGEVAVVCMLGSGNRIAADALPAFHAKRVRILMDADEPKAKEGQKPKAAGLEAAARWQGQLTLAGAGVETYSLYGLVTLQGERVKDLNDLAHCDGETLSNPDIIDAFFEWDF
jgi:hypothetical protein